MANNQINITLDLDKDRLVEIIMNEVESKLCEEFKKNARELILKERWSVRTRYSEATKYDLKDWVSEAIKEAILEYKDDIIKAAAHELSNSMRHSKTVREAFGEELIAAFNAELENENGKART